MRLREINSPGELAVDPGLIDRFTQAGWQIDGEGQDQLVMSKPGSNTVLKIVGAGSQPRQAEIRRYVNFFRVNQRDPHFPRVGADRELAWKGRKYYAYTQERLRPLSGDEAVMDYLEYAMGELGHDQEPDFERIPPGLSVEQVEGLVSAVDHMFQSGLGGQYGFDLANMANIMQRGDGQLVIVDPFSGFDDELDEALVHRGQIRSQDPNDMWHVRDDNTRKLRHHRGTVILAQARPQIYQDDAKASYTYTTDARGRRRRSLPSFHWAYIQGRMVKGLPQDISQGRKLWFKRGQGFVYADSQEPFTAADYVAFNPDGSVVAYDSGRPAAAAGPVVSVEPAQQAVAEVVKMPPTKDSSQGMAGWAYQDAQAKKARRLAPLRTPTPTEVYDLGDHLRVFVQDDQGPVLYLALEKFLDGFKSGAVAVEPRGRGQNLAVKIYQAASDTLGRPIYSDTTQTDASRIGIWQRLISALPGRVVGYDQRSGQDLPLTATDQGPAVRGNQPIYTQRTTRDQPKPVTGQTRSRTRLLKLLPSQQVNEVQILAKVKGKGSEPGQIPKYGRPISADQEVRYLGQQVGRMDRYQLWRDWLGGQLSYHVFDPESRTVVLTTFGSRYHRNPNSYIIHGLYAAPGNPVKAHQFYRNLIQDQGLTLISDRKQSPGGNRVWQRLEAYPDIEVYGFDTKTGEVMNFGAADAEMYAVPPRAAQDRESKYIAKNIRLVATAR